MEIKTTTAQSLHLLSENEKRLDAACKRILSEKVILAHIMKVCLTEYQDCSVDEIAEKYIEGTPQISAIPVMPDEENQPVISGMDTEDKSAYEGTVTYDIRFHAIAPVSGELIGLIINVEAQNAFSPGYPLIKRGIYYCSRMISAQYGRVFTHSHYEKIEKVYSIWICMNPPKERENTITSYSIMEKHLAGEVKEQVKNYDLLSVIMICLGNVDEKKDDGILRMLDVLFSSEISEDEKCRILKNDYGIPMTQTLTEEVSAMGEFAKAFEQRWMEKGLKKGMEKGMEKGIIESLKNIMETLNLTIEQAMAALKIPEADRPQYMQLLEKQ